MEREIEIVGTPGATIGAEMQGVERDIGNIAARYPIETVEGIRCLERDVVSTLHSAGPVLPYVTDFEVSAGVGSIPVRVYRPSAGDEALPVLVWFHGGGFVVGNLDSEDGVCRNFAKRANCAVFNVGYRLSPERKFPVAIEDGWAAIRFICETEGLKIQRDRIAVGGMSAGANLAAGIARLARDAGGPKLCFQLLVVPLLDFTYPRPAVTAPSPGMLELFRASYFSHPDDASDPMASPLLDEGFVGLPPSLIITGEHDALCPQGELYGSKLRAAGVSVRMVRCCGVSHVFFTLPHRIAVAEEAGRLAARALADALSN